MFDAAKSLNRTETAVVIGKDQPFGRNNFTRATSTKDNNGIFERIVVDLIDILCRKTQSLLLHLFDVLFFEQRQEPHSLVGRQS